MADRTTLAMEVLTDLTLTRREALARFAKLTRRWKPVNAAFIFHMAGICRLAKQDRVFDETSISTWCDDGGRA